MPKQTSKSRQSTYRWLRRGKGHGQWLTIVVVAAFFGIGLVASAISNAAPFSSRSSKSLLKPAKSYKTRKNLRYSTISTSKNLTLDLYTPNNGVRQAPLIIFVHGGGFVAGSKDQGCTPLDKGFVRRGFAVACINYRLATEATLPAAIIDTKSAVRALRANASKYNIYPKKIGMWGESAGGHLVAMAGTSARVKKFEKGSLLNISSAVQAVVDDFGPMDLAKEVKESPDKNIKLLGVLMGKNITNNPKNNTSLNPITYINGDEPPFLIRHGDKDTLVPINQSQMLNSALKKEGRKSQYTVFKGAGHGGGDFVSASSLNNVASFFDRYLRP